MAKKGNRVQVILECTEHKATGKPGTSRYITTKNMAKKSVASLQTGSKRLSKAIKMVRSPKTGAYTFVEAIMDPSKVDSFLAKK
mgnify:CR=1 FL=1